MSMWLLLGLGLVAVLCLVVLLGLAALAFWLTRGLRREDFP